MTKIKTNYKQLYAKAYCEIESLKASNNQYKSNIDVYNRALNDKLDVINYLQEENNTLQKELDKYDNTHYNAAMSQLPWYKEKIIKWLKL